MVKPVLFSYPPGTGGDHIIRMLDSQQHQMVDKVVVNYQSLKYLDFENLTSTVDEQTYWQEFQRFLNNGVLVVGTHRCDLLGPPAHYVKLTWQESSTTYRFVCRDIIVNDFNQEFVKSKWHEDMPIWRIFKYPKHTISDRQKVALFTSFAVKQIPITQYQLVPHGWLAFNVDKIFTMDFVDDIINLAQQLSLPIDHNQVVTKQKAWLEKNPSQAFNFRNAVRSLEQRPWIRQRLS